jgi:hypothetical protein
MHISYELSAGEWHEAIPALSQDVNEYETIRGLNP